MQTKQCFAVGEVALQGVIDEFGKGEPRPIVEMSKDAEDADPRSNADRSDRHLSPALKAAASMRPVLSTDASRPMPRAAPHFFAFASCRALASPARLPPPRRP